jgi:hypothetical protein
MCSDLQEDTFLIKQVLGAVKTHFVKTKKWSWLEVYARHAHQPTIRLELFGFGDACMIQSGNRSGTG